MIRSFVRWLRISMPSSTTLQDEDSAAEVREQAVRIISRCSYYTRQVQRLTQHELRSAAANRVACGPIHLT